MDQHQQIKAAEDVVVKGSRFDRDIQRRNDIICGPFTAPVTKLSNKTKQY